MRKLVAGFAASIDGYIEGSDGSLDWIVVDEKIDFANEWKAYDTLLYGRKTYEQALAMGQPPMRGYHHLIFSRTLQRVQEGYTLMQDDLQTSMVALKQTQGKDLFLFGGASLLSSLLNARLVNELVISFIPVLLGAGKPMVAGLLQQLSLSFVSSKRYRNGTVIITYAVEYPAP